MTRVYRYGLLAPDPESWARVDAQISAAHRYQHTLVEIEQRRREAVAACERASGLAASDAYVTALKDELDVARQGHSAENSDLRRRAITNTSVLAYLRAQLRVARAARKARRAEVRGDAAVQSRIAEINAEASAAVRAARAACGVYWGTYLVVEQAMSAAKSSPTPPQFARWTGDGAVAVQLQHGLPVGDATAATDTRLQIDLNLYPVGQGKPRPRVRLRVGSAGRAPVWAEWPLVYHRPLPPEARIMWAKVVRRRVAARYEWSLHVTLDFPDTWRLEPHGLGGAVAVNLSWAHALPGSAALKAGDWRDAMGRGGVVALDPAIRAALTKVDDLRAIRDREFNAALAAARPFVAAHRATWSEAHQQRTTHLAHWRRPARLAALALWWRDHRVDGDEAWLGALEAWRRQDKHLWTWEVHARRKALGRRRDLYRQAAALLARRYDTLIIEALDLRRVAARPEPDDPTPHVAPAARQRVLVAPSEFRAALVHAMVSRGGRVVEVPAAPTAVEMMRAFSEHRGVVKYPAPARTSRFKRLAAEKAAKAAPMTADATTAREVAVNALTA